MPSVSYQPWYVSCTDPPWQIPLTNDANTENITGWNIALFTMTFRSSVNVDTPGTGTFSIVTPSPPVVDYQPSDLDVASPFQGQLFVKAVNPANGKHVVWDPVQGLNGGPFVIIAS